MEYPDVPFTGIIVACNEDERLKECIESLSFCSEVVVVDLDSKDRSVEIAQDCGAIVLNHKRVPTAGVARKYGSEHAKNDWIVFLDPDEVFPSNLYPEMCRLIHNNKKIGRLLFPWKFYFKDDPLEGTRWGGEKHKGHVVNRNRCFIGPPENKYAHQEVSLKEGYGHARVSWESGDHIRHYWMDTYQELFEKHLRYIKNEGIVRYKKGEKFYWVKLIRDPLAAFKNSLVLQDGWKEGFRGLFLSMFWAWYKGASLLALRRQQMSKNSD